MNKIQQSIIKQALEYEYLLTPWEAGFIESLTEAKEPEAVDLTDKQNEALNRIGSKIARERT